MNQAPNEQSTTTPNPPKTPPKTLKLAAPLLHMRPAPRPPRFESSPLLPQRDPDPEPAERLDEGEGEEDAVLEGVAAPGRGGVVRVVGGVGGGVGEAGGGVVEGGGGGEEEGVGGEGEGDC